MSYLTEVNCSTILDAIKNEKKNQKENENGEYRSKTKTYSFLVFFLKIIFFFY